MIYIRTYTGEAVDLICPTLGMIHLEDIAHALAHICRFTGHTSSHYSVAEHSILCAKIAADTFDHDPLTRQCLMHDAAEAYIGDVSSPLKKLIKDSYETIEDYFEMCIRDRFYLGAQSHLVKHIDLEALRIEQRDLMPSQEGTIANPDYSVVGWPPVTAEKMFLQYCAKLGIQ